MFLISSVLGCLGMSFRMMYKSKCKEVDFCCIRVLRDTQGEEKIDEIENNNNKKEQI
jgi:uncharacterized OsmC-like protein